MKTLREFIDREAEFMTTASETISNVTKKGVKNKRKNFSLSRKKEKTCKEVQGM